MNTPSQPRITFAIPYYGGVEYLREAIESVFSQTIADWLLLVSDDARDERVRDVVAKYNDDRIIYFENKQTLGIAGNWNSCIKHSSSQFVTLLHADDRLKPDYAQRMFDLARKYPDATAFFCNARIINDLGAPKFSFTDEFKRFVRPNSEPLILFGESAVSRLLRGNFIICPTLCYRLSRLRQPAFDEQYRFVLDFDWIMRALLNDETLVGTSAIGYDYRRHAQNLTSTLSRSTERFNEEIAFYDLLAANTMRQGMVRASRIAENKEIIKLNLSFWIFKDIFERRWRNAIRKVTTLLRLLRTRQPRQ